MSAKLTKTQRDTLRRLGDGEAVFQHEGSVKTLARIGLAEVAQPASASAFPFVWRITDIGRAALAEAST